MINDIYNIDKYYIYIYIYIYINVHIYTLYIHHIWLRVPKPSLHPIFKISLYCLLHIFKFLSNLPLPSQPLRPMLFLLPCFLDWIGDRVTCWSAPAEVPEGPCCVFYTTKHHVYWGLANNEVFAEHTQGPRLTQPYKYILIPSAMCSQQLSILHWINNLLISQIYPTEFHNFFAFQKLLTCRSHIFVD